MDMKDKNIASLTQFGGAPFFVFCDHASNSIPANLNGLGIPKDILQTHIAWDLGAGPLAMALAQRLDGTAFHCGFSRLIIDPNRDPKAKDLIPATSDQIPIPGNQMLSEEERQRRLADFFTPYHERLSAALDKMTRTHQDFFAVSIHSFTHKLMGASSDRPWQAGLLWREDKTSAMLIKDYLEKNAGWNVGDNEPYDARVFNHSVDQHIGPRKLRHLTIEIRQDMIETNDQIAEVAELIANGVAHTSNTHTDNITQIRTEGPL
ncbi:MAG: N-formylglutamate amidohydrolase [Hyphococcus sp.]|nr:MAG: N-formylglutamate amidohydrolase [Marinicaulis sp.]